MSLLFLAFLGLAGAQEPDFDALLKSLFSADAQASSKAEEDLVDLGAKALPRLERAEKEAPPDRQKLLKRILQEIRDFEAGLESREFDRADELVKRLDERAVRLRRRLSKTSGRPAFVSGVVEKEFGEKLGAPNSYELATFSMEFDTRDLRHVRNDPDFFLTDATIRVRTVTDDRSEIWDLGETDFDAKTWGDAKPEITVRVAKNRLYIIHTDDGDTNCWWKLAVIEHRPRQWILFRWEPLPVGAGVLKLERTPERVLQAGRARIQIRAGDFDKSPMRLYPDGTKGPNLADVRAKPLDMDTKVDGYESQGFVQGGLIPVGKVWILRRARVKGSCPEAGSFRLVAKGTPLAAVSRTAKTLDESWTGRIVLRPGEERLVYLEAAYFTRCDATISGWLCDERLADVETFPELKPEEKKRFDELTAALEAPKAEVSERAMKDLVEWGPPVLAILQASKRTPRLEEVIRRINGE